MSDVPHQPQRLLARISRDSWAVAIATALLVLIIAARSLVRRSAHAV